MMSEIMWSKDIGETFFEEVVFRLKLMDERYRSNNFINWCVN